MSDLDSGEDRDLYWTRKDELVERLEAANKALDDLLSHEDAPDRDERWLQWCDALDGTAEALALLRERTPGERTEALNEIAHVANALNPLDPPNREETFAEYRNRLWAALAILAPGVDRWPSLRTPGDTEPSHVRRARASGWTNLDLKGGAWHGTPPGRSDTNYRVPVTRTDRHADEVVWDTEPSGEPTRGVVQFWRNDALEAAAQIAERYRQDDVACYIRMMIRAPSPEPSPAEEGPEGGVDLSTIRVPRKSYPLGTPARRTEEPEPKVTLCANCGEPRTKHRKVGDGLRDCPSQPTTFEPVAEGERFEDRLEEERAVAQKMPENPYAQGVVKGMEIARDYLAPQRTPMGAVALDEADAALTALVEHVRLCRGETVGGGIIGWVENWADNTRQSIIDLRAALSRPAQEPDATTSNAFVAGWTAVGAEAPDEEFEWRAGGAFGKEMIEGHDKWWRIVRPRPAPMEDTEETDATD